MFSYENQYTRSDIAERVGGRNRGYLPRRDGIILAGCFNEEQDPDCPNQVQVGSSDDVMEHAELLISQPETVFPVFTKQSKNSKHYRYRGQYRFVSYSKDRAKLAEAEVVSGRHGELTCLLNLERVRQQLS